ncbi:copper resistance system multicopper oxidase [Sphingomonas sp. DT-204]|uniref:copper resistance system multicopper oxidase n=1 Tax=Sphingomonas sp. DT-204 TaxID=3396166 RepID=UPI003F1AB5A6
MDVTMDRRRLLRSTGRMGGGLALAAWMPAWAQTNSAGIAAPLPEVSGEDITLRVAHQMMTIDGRPSHAIGINGTVPAPLIRLREGQDVRLHVVNDLDEETSVHWHGLILPFQMDGVPGISFPGIRPRSTFTYAFPIVQSGTYWYHSHSGLQEQLGHYGPILIEPRGPDPVAHDRQHVIVLSDHSRLHPHAIFMKLKQQPGYFNRQRQTLSSLLEGKDQPLKERLTWGGMRMDPTDISDVTGSTYTYLVNGHGPRDNWTGLFKPGERVRLRFVNASAMTIFNVRIPGLRMTVVQADGQNVRPVQVDELQITVAETYDVVVTPADERAYTLVAEAADRSGMARATLAPRPGMTAEVPPLRKRPIATMKDMGMDMSGMDHGAMSHDGMAGMDHGNMAGMDHSGSAPGAGMAGMSMTMRDPANAPQVRMGPGVQTISQMPVDRTGEPGQGLESVGHRVLTYRDLVALERNPDVRAPAREVEIHLTGNMERFMWSFDGEKFSEVKAPIAMRAGERVRVTLVNDSMMAHPIHLHGHFFELVTGHGDHAPRKHTVNVLPGGRVSWDVTAAPGDWAFHCHLLYHMHAGMMQVVRVRPLEGEGA